MISIIEELIRESHENNKLAYVSLIGTRLSEISIYISMISTSPNAEAWIKRPLMQTREYGTMWDLANDHALYADWFKKKDDLSKAKEQLTKAIDLFRECGADGWVERTEKALAEFS